MSNKDLLKLENEFRDELPKYKSKPNIGPVPKPDRITNRVSAFLANVGKQSDPPPKSDDGQNSGKTNGNNNCDKVVEMDIYITPTE